MRISGAWLIALFPLFLSGCGIFGTPPKPLAFPLDWLDKDASISNCDAIDGDFERIGEVIGPAGRSSSVIEVEALHRTPAHEPADFLRLTFEPVNGQLNFSSMRAGIPDWVVMEFPPWSGLTCVEGWWTRHQSGSFYGEMWLGSIKYADTTQFRAARDGGLVFHYVSKRDPALDLELWYHYKRYSHAAPKPSTAFRMQSPGISATLATGFP